MKFNVYISLSNEKAVIINNFKGDQFSEEEINL